MMQKAKNLERRREEAIKEKKELLQDVEETVSLKINPLRSSKQKLIIAKRYLVCWGEITIFSDFSMELTEESG